ncbi:MAG: polyphosphate polymerase domain-containing protein [Humibacillus sp.]|nr:polyphosphate polymerase domain-containing protein [Humibacillus sp.]MDN5779815.1 polyphosphate polymerase domain-containing protein [Humibacillus sp.]
MTPARRALSVGCAALTTTSLEHIIATADLQTRVDRKYLVPPAVFAEFLARLNGRMKVLDIDGRRLFEYESVYFDTPELLAYHQHVGGRRRRFKVRTRTYVDSAESMLEVKTAGGRDETVKDRHPYQLGERYELTPQAREVVGGRLGDTAVAERLELSLVSRYHRATLVEPATGSRLTCDVDLDFEDPERRQAGPDGLVLIESKTSGAASLADRTLWRLGHRPATVTKYCVGLALLHPGLRANRWNRTLRGAFGWSPCRSA